MGGTSTCATDGAMIVRGLIRSFTHHLDVERHALRQPQHGLAALEGLDLRQQHILAPVDRVEALPETKLGKPNGLELLFLARVSAK